MLLLTFVSINPPPSLLLTLSPLSSLLQVWQRPVQVRGACRRFGADRHPGAGGGSQEVQGSERRSRSGFVEAAQQQRSLSDLRPQHQRSMPPSRRQSLRWKHSIFLCCHGYRWLDRSRWVLFSRACAACVSLEIKRDAAKNVLSIRRQRMTQHFYHARIY